ncbi:SusC/RagA family TonB-linked outer membrane protein [Niabella yanshanensis]|uniref:SusC/RagA family TonB-linked outer membrane protein n=1 Tax=Niabella yanshanensis TaxID=577386 RepID=A0ABZ0WB55_9BACT|nr:SusC/RagA family TonB-linked outer membrane protein [Niabella yanshanensis]WQD39702.1 SusC/RagA family TonB-linked outer membrane protein [Niabella yanshanensis]
MNTKLLLGPYFLCTLFIFLFIPMLVGAQDGRTDVRGVVRSEGGDLLRGVTVVIKNARADFTVSTQTDSLGIFRFSQLPAGEGYSFSISSVGFEPQELTGYQLKANANFTLSIKLKETGQSLNEVVVIGYGTQRKGDITSSVASVKAEDFIKGAVKDAGQLIQGKVAGLTVINPSGDPTGSTQLILRGQSTLMGVNQNPLVLIDGVPGDLRMITPQDIESVDVLKDGSAAAIYGTRGTNGVIFITTKRAGANNRTSVEYSTYAGIQKIARQLTMSTAADMRAQIESGQRKNELIDQGAATDWLKEITRTPVIQDHNLTIRGGNGVTNYLASLNYDNAQGLFLKSFNQIFSGRFDINHSMFDNKLKLNVNAFSSSRRLNGFNSNIYRQALMQNPTAPLKNEDGTWFQELTKFDYQSPVSDIMESDGETSESLSRYNGTISFLPVKGLKFSALFSYSKWMQKYGYAETKQHASTLRDGRNGYANDGGAQSIDRLTELTGEYTKSFNRHNLTALAGYSYQENDYTNHYMENWDFPTDIFSWHNIGLGRAISSGEFVGLIRNYKTETNLVGFFGRLSYNYDQRYLLMASLRREKASQLWGTRNPWGVFPAVSAGWRISREKFMQNQNVFDDLKLRVGYGVTGSQPSDLFRGVALLGYSGFVLSDGKWVQTIIPTQNANPDLKWEEKRETNIGLDFSMLKGRLSGSIDLYNRQIHNLLYLFEVPSPPNLYNRTLANVGTLENKGLEVLVNFTPVMRKNFQWNSMVNFSTNSNKLKSLSNDLYRTSTDYLRVGAIFPPIQTFSHLLRVGGSVGDFYGYKVVDIGNDPADAANYGQWIYEGRDGTPVKYADFAHAFEDKKVIGNGLPRYYLTWNNNLQYKSWDLGITQRGAFKFQVANLQRMMFENPTQAQYNLLKNAYDPVYGKAVLKSPVEFNSYYIENGDFWKIDNITLGYSIKTDKIKYIKSARIYIATLNTFIITGYKGIDPEVSLRNGTSSAQSGVLQVPTSGLDPGMDSPYKYPTTRTFSIGLNVNF